MLRQASLTLCDTGQGRVPSTLLIPHMSLDTYPGGTTPGRCAGAVAGWRDLAGRTSCRGSASYPGKDLAGVPDAGLQSSGRWLERLLAFGCAPEGLAAGVATTARAQGVLKAQTSVHRH